MSKINKESDRVVDSLEYAIASCADKEEVGKLLFELCDLGVGLPLKLMLPLADYIEKIMDK
jgi:hypothetical protein